jgi:transposase
MENKPHLISKRCLDIKRIERVAGHWVVHASSRAEPICPACGTDSKSLHSRYRRHLWDMPIQGVAVRLNVQTRRWCCHNERCRRRIFVERLGEVARPHARWSRAVEKTLVAFGHGAGGRLAERLLGIIGVTVSDNTIVRHLRREVSQRAASSNLRVVGIDDWAWTKGQSYGTIIVNLESRTVADVLPDRSVARVATWRRQQPGVEVVCRDRFGLHAEGARQGAPNACQVADRFHRLPIEIGKLHFVLATEQSRCQ